MFFSQLQGITGGEVIRFSGERPVTALLTDSRKAVITEGAIFFAIGGQRHDGHKFIPGLYALGVRQFVIERMVTVPGPEANILLVDSAVRALQKIAAEHRAKMSLPVLGITGSNGKTIIKEWLYQLLSPDFKIAKNPASYNSQLGVPLSVWQIQPYHNLGIFEAGISTTGEMEHLEKVMRPTIGVFANIGSAHSEGFDSLREKVYEKRKLFQGTNLVIYCKDHLAIDEAILESQIPGLAWGINPEAAVRIEKVQNATSTYRVTTASENFDLTLPFSDNASVENCFHCVTVLLHFGIPPREIQHRLASLRAVPMRLELKEGINQCQIIDDTYNNDLAGLQVSLDFLAQQQQKSKKCVILSDIHESGLSDTALMQTVSSMIGAADVSTFVGIGPIMFSNQKNFPSGSSFFLSTGEFLKNFDFNTLRDEVILVKGARPFTFEKIVHHLERKVHGTVMEIDLGALVDNLNFFKTCLKPPTKVMAMVKAFGYGSGSSEIANVLQYHRVDYLGVAYADEGVELRQNNITLPIMVMNPSEESFDTMIRYDLEPEIYSLRILEHLDAFLRGVPCRIHIKVDTGMRRLGFDEAEIDGLLAFLEQRPHLHVASVFSHLAGADEAAHDAFSKTQADRFRAIYRKMIQRLNYRPLCHLLNSSGILRFNEFQFDMVRLGIGLYGIDPTNNNARLRPVAALKTIISQIKHIQAGESIGYGRRGRAVHAMTIATIAIGYADGFSRAFSHGVGKVCVHGTLAPVVGNVCMDMTMIDVTGIPASEGDEVEIFGKQLPILELARTLGTIPYEILTNTSERVKRIFVAESI